VRERRFTPRRESYDRSRSGVALRFDLTQWHTSCTASRRTPGSSCSPGKSVPARPACSGQPETTAQY